MPEEQLEVYRYSSEQFGGVRITSVFAAKPSEFEKVVALKPVISVAEAFEGHLALEFEVLPQDFKVCPSHRINADLIAEVGPIGNCDVYGKALAEAAAMSLAYVGREIRTLADSFANYSVSTGEAFQAAELLREKYYDTYTALSQELQELSEWGEDNVRREEE